MRSDCDKIKQLLESEIEDEQTLKIIESHLQQCDTCELLVNLDNRLESELSLSLPISSPQVITQNVMTKVIKSENGVFSKLRFNDIYPYLLAVLTIIPISTVIWGWSSVKSFLMSFNISGLLHKLSSLRTAIPELSSILPDYALQYMASSQMMMILIVFAALIWAFSIFEMEKAIK